MSSSRHMAANLEGMPTESHGPPNVDPHQVSGVQKVEVEESDDEQFLRSVFSRKSSQELERDRKRIEEYEKQKARQRADAEECKEDPEWYWLKKAAEQERRQDEATRCKHQDSPAHLASIQGNCPVGPACAQPAAPQAARQSEDRQSCGPIHDQQADGVLLTKKRSWGSWSQVGRSRNPSRGFLGALWALACSMILKRTDLWDILEKYF